MRHIINGIIALFVLSLIIYAAVELKLNIEKDETMPVISADTESIWVSVNATDEELMVGLTAKDEKDGDLTSEIVVGNKSKFIKKGTINVTYVVFDQDNNLAQLTRKVNYLDYESPKFSLADSLDFYVGEVVSVLQVLKATDSIDGDITDKIRIISSDVNNREVGTYSVKVQVSSDYGDTCEIMLPVNIHANAINCPTITLTSYMVYLKVGEKISPEKYISNVVDAYGSAIDKDSVQIENNVDTACPGVYQISYTVVDEKGKTGVCNMVVVVEETLQEEK